MSIVNLIHLFFGIIGFLTGLFPFSIAFTTISSFIAGVVSYVPDFTTYVGYVYYFIPKNVLSPLILVSTSCLTFRISMALVNLIWW